MDDVSVAIFVWPSTYIVKYHRFYRKVHLAIICSGSYTAVAAEEVKEDCLIHISIANSVKNKKQTTYFC